MLFDLDTSSIYLVLYYLSMYIRAWLSHVYIAARRSERACKSPSSVYIGAAARLTPFLVSLASSVYIGAAAPVPPFLVAIFLVNKLFLISGC